MTARPRPRADGGDVAALRRETLRRQFPSPPAGRGPAEVAALVGRVGPIQSQAPRAAFLAAAARLPGVTLTTLTEAFEQYVLVVASNLRGTVHTSTPHQFRLLQALSAPLRAADLRRVLRLQTVTPSQVVTQLEQAATDGWCERGCLVAAVDEWLSRVEADLTRPAWTTFSENLVWGYPGLLRRPRSGAWHRRGETLHRLATGTLPDHRPPVETAEARRALVRLHLSAYGPATRRDVAWWLGNTLTAVDQAVTQLGDELVQQAGPGRDPLLDLAQPPAAGAADPAVRLLPEFDGLLLGFAPENRDRFLRPAHLPHVWNRANGAFKPVVLAHGHIAGTWQLTDRRGHTVLEVTPLPGEAVVGSDLFAAPAAAVAAALARPVDDVHVRPLTL